MMTVILVVTDPTISNDNGNGAVVKYGYNIAHHDENIINVCSVYCDIHNCVNRREGN